MNLIARLNRTPTLLVLALLLLPTLLAGYALMVALSQATSTPPPGAETSAPKVEVVIPAAPATQDAKSLCERAATVGAVSRGEVHIDGSAARGPVYGYSAAVGFDRLTWTDNPPGANFTAFYNGQAILIGPEIQRCLKDNGKVQ